MKKVKLLLAFLMLSVLSINAQTNTNEPTYYKVTFLDIDQFQLKEMVPVCGEIFDAIASNKGEPDVLYFNSTVQITKEILRKKLDDKSVNYQFKLEIIEDEK